jgi:hypothetical protein
MKTPVIVLAVVVAHVLLGTPGDAEAQASRFDGRWQNENGAALLRWIDIRIIDTGGPSFLAWWSCGQPDGCLFNGRVNQGGGAPIEIFYAQPQWKTQLWIGDGDGGTIMIREETSWADGRRTRSMHRMHRIPTTVSSPLPDVVVGRGLIQVRTADGRVQEVRQPNPGNQPPPRPKECTRTNPNEECRGVKIDVQMLRPPFNPDDPSGEWIRQYNALLAQVLAKVLTPRPDLLDAYARTESTNDNDYDRFVRRSEFLDFLTRPQP